MEYTTRFLNQMENLKKAGKFYDYNLKNEVESKMIELGESTTDEQAEIFSRLDDAEDDEFYYTHIHALASSLNIK